MTISQAISSARAQLHAKGIASAQLDAQLLLAHTLAKPKEYLIAHDDRLLTDSEMQVFESYISRRVAREPLCYITNSIEFYGIDFYVDSRVLAPRVETEAMVEQVVKHAPQNAKVIDIGTGSGALAIAIAKNRPDLHMTATDVSTEALEVARINATQILGKNHKIVIVHSDIFTNVSGVFDIVATNLPYLAKSSKVSLKPEVAREPAVALFGGPDGLDLYRTFYRDVAKYTTKDALVYHESDPWQHAALAELASTAGFTKTYEDYFILGFSRLKHNKN